MLLAAIPKYRALDSVYDRKLGAQPDLVSPSIAPTDSTIL